MTDAVSTNENGAGAQSGAVKATAWGPWPGTDPREAHRVVRGELGEPHLPHLAELPMRGVGSDPVGRTAAMLPELPIDLQPHGWRLVPRPGRDFRRAAAALAADMNALADVAGAEERPAAALKVQLRGPLSLAANLHLHHGERALLDVGARRDIADSLAAGLAEHVWRASAAACGAGVVVQIDEPEIEAVMTGTIPTSSGYRTLRAIPASEVSRSWQLAAEAARAAGAVEVVVSVPAHGAPFEQLTGSGLDGFVLPVDGLTSRQWEAIAGAVEGGLRLWAGVMNPDTATVPQVSALVESVRRPWRAVGLEYRHLDRLTVLPNGGLDRLGLSEAKKILTRVVHTADALNQIMAEEA